MMQLDVGDRGGTARSLEWRQRLIELSCVSVAQVI